MSTETQEPPPSETLYIRNIKENIKIPVLKESLDAAFSLYGPILDIIAHGNIRMRGQAFVVFEDVETAKRALDEVQGFPLFGDDQPLEIHFAKSKSDAVVSKAGEEELEEHRKIRLAEKDRKKAEFEAAQKKRKRQGGALSSGRPSKKSALGASDEQLPPNKILFLQNLPDDITADQLTETFEEYAGFFEVRLVPGRKGIAFVEYETDENAVVAKQGTEDLKLGDKPVKVTFARK
ncbi:U1 small nuclear ribonucleoprotein usp102 [Myxozyma melibiosi]|uniref:U1 small nuclear ribonucleoprotein usp102 n=1 Tax=Myxozyma melibiosi TaxID=54550 RepID=A0ABR1F688_9ASCO